MGLKFVIQPDPVLINNFRLDIVGLPSITFTAVGALEQETDKVELPDRTTTSGGRDKPGEAEISVPAHHAVEIAAMNAWRQEAKDPISPLFKKVGTLTAWGGALTTQLVKTIMGLLPLLRKQVRRRWSVITTTVTPCLRPRPRNSV